MGAYRMRSGERLEAEDAGSWSKASAVILRAWIDLRRGDADEAARRLDCAETLIAETGYADLPALFWAVRCAVALQRGELGVARHVAKRLRALTDDQGPMTTQYQVERSAGLIELSAGRPDAAAPHVRAAIECADTLAH